MTHATNTVPRSPRYALEYRRRNWQRLTSNPAELTLPDEGDDSAVCTSDGGDVISDVIDDVMITQQQLQRKTGRASSQHTPIASLWRLLTDGRERVGVHHALPTGSRATDATDWLTERFVLLLLQHQRTHAPRNYWTEPRLSPSTMTTNFKLHLVKGANFHPSPPISGPTGLSTVSYKPDI